MTEQQTAECACGKCLECDARAYHRDEQQTADMCGICERPMYDGVCDLCEGTSPGPEPDWFEAEADRRAVEVVALALYNEKQRFFRLPQATSLTDIEPHRYRDQLRYAHAAIAAARPMIEAEEREKCAALAEAEIGEVDQLSAFSLAKIAAAIRAMGGDRP